MANLARLYRTSIGAKAVMAITGAMLFLFLIGHLAGNLLIFKGQDAINSYAQGLQNLGAGLWVIRLGLLAVFLLHIATAMRLHHGNREARPVAYYHEDTVKATWASRYMMMTGLVVLAFVIYHLLHFTFHQFAPRGIGLDDQGRKQWRLRYTRDLDRPDGTDQALYNLNYIAVTPMRVGEFDPTAYESLMDIDLTPWKD